jgi:hypothetical protein
VLLLHSSSILQLLLTEALILSSELPFVLFCLSFAGTGTIMKSDLCGEETIPGRVSGPERPGQVLVARPVRGGEVEMNLYERCW